MDRRFLVQVAVTFLTGIGLALVGTLLAESTFMISAIIVGGVLSTINVAAGIFAIEYSLNKSQETFMKAVLGGMGIRMLVMLGILALLIKFSGLHVVALVASLLGFYAVYLILELLYIQRKVSHKQPS